MTVPFGSQAVPLPSLKKYLRLIRYAVKNRALIEYTEGTNMRIACVDLDQITINDKKAEIMSLILGDDIELKEVDRTGTVSIFSLAVQRVIV
jgi:hypothetical protein